MELNGMELNGMEWNRMDYRDFYVQKRPFILDEYLNSG